MMNWTDIIANTPNFDKRKVFPGADYVVLVFGPDKTIRIHNGKVFANEANARRVVNSLIGRRDYAHLEVRQCYS